MNFIDDKLEEFCVKYSSDSIGIIGQEIKERTLKSSELPQMLSGEMENSFLGFLIRISNPKVLVEFGTFTGYATASMAMNSAVDAVVYTMDKEGKHNKANQSDWKKAGIQQKIQFFQADALVKMYELPKKWDFVFIDADKENYPQYLEFAITKLSENGIVAVDNALWSGKVLQSEKDGETQAIFDTIEMAKCNPNLYVTLLPIRDGILLVQKRSH
ncbi:class I SAM-dependent methyltransferase [Bacteriovoracaceae bacterium]|nr:class I SAM-dependent methyltransferase [Bacteriovoracaceae bacterium]